MLPLNEQAYQHLQKLILSNRLSYGQIYSETRLSRELGISRTPFRDASTDSHRKVILILFQAKVLPSIRLMSMM